MQKKASIRDIANEAGLSITAVSLVLNNRPNKVSTANRERILEIAKRLNYHPSQQAVNLLRKRTMSIAQIVPDIMNSFYTTIVRSVDEEARRHGYNIILHYTDNSPKRELESFQSAYRLGVDGILSVSSNILVRDQVFAMLSDFQIPTVMLDYAEPNRLYTSFCYNHVEGGYLAMQHLLSIGHRRIACIYAGDFPSLEISPRFQGCMKAYREFGIVQDAETLFQATYFSCDSTIKGGYDITETILERGFTAIFCFNQSIALGAYRFAADHGMHIPEDFSVISYDDSYLSEILNPPMTAIVQDANLLGTEGILHLLNIIENEDVPSMHTDYKPHLALRKSTGVPPKDTGWESLTGAC